MSVCKTRVLYLFLLPAIRRMGEDNSFSLFTFRGGGVPGPGPGPGGVPGPGGRVPGLRSRGYPVSGQRGVPSLSKGKNF